LVSVPISAFSFQLLAFSFGFLLWVFGVTGKDILAAAIGFAGKPANNQGRQLV
jgi:hypothetical protein